MTQPNKTINVYCDESCHLQADDSSVMALGAVYCPQDHVKLVATKLRELKKKYRLTKTFETKWSKISPSKVDFYLALTEYFFSEPALKFRGVIIPDKAKLDHARFNQTHDEWYYKMYYTMLLRIINPSNTYHFYLDIKDTRGGSKTRTLQDYLANKIFDFDKECVARVQQIRSHESEILQLSDVFTGALAYGKRELATSEAKKQVVGAITSKIPTRTLNQSTHYHYNKFNFLVWSGR